MYLLNIILSIDDKVAGSPINLRSSVLTYPQCLEIHALKTAIPE